MYEYHYCNVKIATVSYSKSSGEVDVHDIFTPWGWFTNNDGSFFCKMSIVEDQVLGVNIIDLDNVVTLFVEHETNLDIQAGKKVIINAFTPATGYVTAAGFAQMLEDNIVQAANSMKGMLNSQGSKLTGISNASKSTFPIWKSHTNKVKIKTIK
jgi:hypothetical protein